ncbi:hypothetical protein CHELA1G11_13799 [Hyphomicrobiales bacterium]|nr:hypothetical protein CHELA1G2_10516 [Hyphomicrobiales bacterium]CAH1674126.1 hypothetical protein CHELA1G11_13799 [Hyphomicrobiales bacterium]
MENNALHTHSNSQRWGINLREIDITITKHGERKVTRRHRKSSGRGTVTFNRLLSG